MAFQGFKGGAGFHIFPLLQFEGLRVEAREGPQPVTEDRAPRCVLLMLLALDHSRIFRGSQINAQFLVAADSGLDSGLFNSNQFNIRWGCRGPLVHCNPHGRMPVHPYAGASLRSPPRTTKPPLQRKRPGLRSRAFCLDLQGGCQSVYVFPTIRPRNHAMDGSKSGVVSDVAPWFSLTWPWCVSLNDILLPVCFQRLREVCGTKRSAWMWLLGMRVEKPDVLIAAAEALQSHCECLQSG